MRAYLKIKLEEKEHNETNKKKRKSHKKKNKKSKSIDPSHLLVKKFLKAKDEAMKPMELNDEIISEKKEKEKEEETKNKKLNIKITHYEIDFNGSFNHEK